MEKENIILVGFMGTGKTAIGKRLANNLNKTFYDADKEIETLTGMSLMTLYHKYGKVRFESEEELMLAKLLKEKNCVIATGGSLFLNEERLLLLQNAGTVICLMAEPQIIMERIQRRNNRPLLSRENMYDEIIQLSKLRENIYAKTDLVIDTSSKGFEEILEQIQCFLKLAILEKHY